MRENSKQNSNFWTKVVNQLQALRVIQSILRLPIESWKSPERVSIHCKHFHGQKHPLDVTWFVTSSKFVSLHSCIVNMFWLHIIVDMNVWNLSVYLIPNFDA